MCVLYVCVWVLVGFIKTVVSLVISSCSTIYCIILTSELDSCVTLMRMCANEYCMGYAVQFKLRRMCII